MKNTIHLELDAELLASAERLTGVAEPGASASAGEPMPRRRSRA